MQEELLECAQLLRSPENPGNTPVSRLLQEGCLQAQVPLKRSLSKRPKGSSRTRRFGDMSWLSLQAAGLSCQPRAHGMAGHNSGHRKGLPATDTHGTVP